MKQKGLVKLEGTSDDFTFYKSKDGYLARAKGGVSKDRIKNDPNFVRVRENGKEFGSAAAAGKLLRTAAGALMKNARDFRIVSRLQYLMMTILKLDTTSVRGERNVGEAVSNPVVLAMLKGFEFNNKSQINTILFKPYSVDTVTGKITIDKLVPNNDIVPPEGATHMTLRGAYANVNFEDGSHTIAFTNKVNLLLADSTDTDVSLTPTGVPAGTGCKLYLFQIEFFQMINAVQYELNNGSYNALVIAEVA